MTQRDEWIAEVPKRAWLGRLLAPDPGAEPTHARPAGTRPATSALVVAGLAALAFVASMSLRWQTLTFARDFVRVEVQESVVVADNVTNPLMLGQVYALGVVVMLGLVGAALSRATLALRLRMMAAGVTVGLLGVVVAVTISLPALLANQYTQGVFANTPGVRISYEPGLLCAYAAVVLPIVSIWLASRPAAHLEAARLEAARLEAARLEGTRLGGSRFDEARPPRARADVDLTVTPER